ncbi:hypothetical protein [Flavobacterium sp.]
MQPKDFFKKTFVFVFVFFIVYKAVGILFDMKKLNLSYIMATLAAAVVVSMILATINYYARIDFFSGKNNKPKNN